MVRTGVGIWTALFLISGLGWAQEEKTSSLDIIGKTHTISAYNSFSGSGMDVPNLANTYDMSIFEFNLGGKQSKFNGSGVTTNSNYPLVDGTAFTNNTHVGLAKSFAEGTKTGFLVELYTLEGDKTVGRVFGEELPWDDFPRNDSGTIHPARFQADLYNAFIEGSKDDFQYKLVGGTLTPRDLPEFTRKEMNQVKLGSLLYRAPITNASFFEKEDRKIEEGRHPLRGFDFIGNYAYGDHRSVHLELFSGATKPTPISDIERSAYGGRVAADIGKGNIGGTLVYNSGIRHTSAIEENQWVWAVDSSYPWRDWLTPYITFARTDYERENTQESHNANAYVAGALIKLPPKHELKLQYQRVEENYDLMAYHKTEHYPGNTQGVNAQMTFLLTETVKLKGIVGHYQQLETATSNADTIFGDSFFPSNASADKGTIDIQRIGADWKASGRFLVNAYIEHAKFFQEAPIGSDIDKDVYNFFVNTKFFLSKKLSVEGGFRRFLSKGDWQAMAFDSYQDIPEAAITYYFDKDTRAQMIYHHYNFEDDNIIAQGQNDYHGHQVIMEVKIPL